MDFKLTWEQEALVEQVDAFCRKEIASTVDERDRSKYLRDAKRVKELLKQLRPFGVLAGPVSEQCGGAGLDYVTTGLVNERLAQYWASLHGICMIQTAAARLIAEIDNDEVRERFLPSICSGELIACAGITEPDVGSNPINIGTTLTKVKGGYAVNGTKTWISNGSISDVAIVIATVDRMAGAKGLAAVLVDRRESPYETRELDKLGLRAFPTSELYFTDTFVPKENVLAAPGKGLKTTLRTFELARSLMGTASVGYARAAIKLAVEYAQQREQFGKKIASFQLVQSMIADMRARTDAAAFLVYRALWMMDQGMRCEAESALGKFYATEAAVATTSECIQILGAYGLSEEYPAERLFRDARSMTIPDGTTQIQKMIVAREMLGVSAFV